MKMKIELTFKICVLNRFEEINNILVSELIDSPPTIKTSLSDLNIFKYN